MFTAEMFKNEKRKNSRILTTEEVNEALRQGGKSIMEIREVLPDARENEKGICFFMNDYLFGHGVLPSNFVPSSTQMPIQVKERPSVPSGQVTNAEEYIAVFSYDAIQINHIDELVDYLNQHYHTSAT